MKLYQDAKRERYRRTAVAPVSNLKGCGFGERLASTTNRTIRRLSCLKMETGATPVLRASGSSLAASDGIVPDQAWAQLPCVSCLPLLAALALLVTYQCGAADTKTDSSRASGTVRAGTLRFVEHRSSGRRFRSHPRR